MSEPYPYFEVDHGSHKWHQWHAGKITASKFLAVQTVGNGQPWGAPALAYAEQLAIEIITGEPGEPVEARALSWGRDHEPIAREEYTARTLHHVEHPRRVYYRPGTLIGGTPDGLCKPNGGMEIKCPHTRAAHFRTIFSGQMPKEHIPQVMGYMWLTGADWWDFVSFDPRFPEGSRLFVQRIARNDQYIANLSMRCLAFQQLVIDVVKKFGYDGDPLALANPPEPDTVVEAEDGETGAEA
jgi:hypothetical protein